MSCAGVERLLAEVAVPCTRLAACAPGSPGRRLPLTISWLAWTSIRPPAWMMAWATTLPEVGSVLSACRVPTWRSGMFSNDIRPGS
ncbi:hypothetical protein D9M68_532010 [compost metagenome]